jgi:hypothetical protein
MRAGVVVMASTLQSEINAAHLERAARLAGEAFAVAYDDDEAAPSPRGGNARLFGLGLFVIVFLGAMIRFG